MKELITSIKMLFVMTVWLGGLYPLAVTAVGRALFPHQANGSLLEQGGKIVGSELLAQKFAQPRYFWPRPSAVDFNPLPSGGSNLSPSSSGLKSQYDERRTKLFGGDAQVPQDLLFASASGLDPHISVAAAAYQAPRVAKARSLEVQRVTQVIDRIKESRQFKVLGEERVNVLKLNQALDEMSAEKP